MNPLLLHRPTTSSILKEKLGFSTTPSDFAAGAFGSVAVIFDFPNRDEAVVARLAPIPRSDNSKRFETEDEINGDFTNVCMKPETMGIATRRAALPSIIANGGRLACAAVFLQARRPRLRPVPAMKLLGRLG